MSNSNDPSLIRRISSFAGTIPEKIISSLKEPKDEFKNFDKLVYEERFKQIQKQINDLKDSRNELKNEINNLKERIEQLENNYENIKDVNKGFFKVLSDLEEEIKNIKKQISQSKNDFKISKLDLITKSKTQKNSNQEKSKKQQNSMFQYLSCGLKKSNHKE